MTSYATFIITRHRPFILLNTIKIILNQLIVPQTILIVDNSDDEETKNLLNGLDDSRIQYYRTGFNAGPAGGAKIGLSRLFDQGYTWIMWGDDDNPPVFKDSITKLFDIVSHYSDPDKIGMIGCVGVLFNKNKAKVERIPDRKLNGIIEVDNIAGNMMPIIHRRVLEKNIFPDPDLFFGFEELDFSLAVKKNGLKLLVSGEEIMRHRVFWDRTNLKKRLYVKKDIKHLWREYYSVRNLIHILKKVNLYLTIIKFSFSILLKLPVGYYWGLKYGTKQMIYLIKGLYDGVFSKMGKRVIPRNK